MIYVFIPPVLIHPLCIYPPLYMFSFFLVDIIIGASLLDRLWLLGGITGAWWASGAVTRNTRGGALARRVGAQVAQYIRDLQEKYNQAVIFYQTGKMAYVSSKTWEKYDAQFQITQVCII
jgi:hypothetical protein